MDLEEHRMPGYKTGHDWYFIHGFCYIKSRVRRGVMILRCADRQCHATYQWSPMPDRRLIRGSHDHGPNSYLVQRNQLYQHLRQRVQGEVISVAQIYEELVPLYPEGAVHMPLETVISTLRFWRRQARPAVPRTVGEYAEALRTMEQYHNMVLGTVSAGGAAAVVLAMPNFEQVLRASTIIMVDGTFQTVPAGMAAAQLLTVHAVCEGHFYHPIMALTENRTRVLYAAILRLVWRRVGGHANLQYVVTDYEEGLQRAVEEVLAVRVQGCFFHYAQALLRRAAHQVGPVNRRDSPALRLVRIYIALALLPPALIAPALAEVPQMCDNVGLVFSQGFHEYYQQQWITRTTPERFSVYGSAHRTTNVCESFHEGLRRALHAHPNAWTFTETLRNKFATSAARFATQRNNAGRPLARRSYVRPWMRTNVAALQLQLEQGRITVRQFVEDVARVIPINVELIPEEDAPPVGAEVVIDGGLEMDDDVEMEEAAPAPVALVPAARALAAPPVAAPALAAPPVAAPALAAPPVAAPALAAPPVAAPALAAPPVAAPALAAPPVAAPALAAPAVAAPPVAAPALAAPPVAAPALAAPAVAAPALAAPAVAAPALAAPPVAAPALAAPAVAAPALAAPAVAAPALAVPAVAAPALAAPPVAAPALAAPPVAAPALAAPPVAAPALAAPAVAAPPVAAPPVAAPALAAPPVAAPALAAPPVAAPALAAPAVAENFYGDEHEINELEELPEVRLREVVPDTAEGPAEVLVSCGVCYNAAPERFLVPCGHTMCHRCEVALRVQHGRHIICPFCRVRVEQTSRFFLNIL